MESEPSSIEKDIIKTNLASEEIDGSKLTSKTDSESTDQANNPLENGPL